MKRWTIRTQLAPPVFPGDENKTRRAILLNSALLTCSVLALCLIAGNLAGGAVPAAVTGLNIVLFVGCLVLRRWTYQGRIGLASGVLVVVGLVGITLAVAVLGTIRAPATAMYVLLVIAAGLLFDLRGMIATTVLCSLAIAGLIVAENTGLLPRPDTTVTITQWVTYTVLFAWAGSLTFFALRSLRQTLARAEQEIADRKRAEEALRESEEQYRRLFERASLGIFQSTPEGKAIAVNPAFARMFGYDSPKDAIQSIGDVAADLFVDPNRRAEIIRLLAEQPDLRTFENLYRRKDGSSFIGSLNTMPIRDSDGRLVRIEGIIEDITERKRAEEALMESSAQFRTLFEASPDAIVLIDPHDHWPILDCNTAACQMNGYSRDELVGQSIDVFNLTPGAPAERAEYMERIRQSGVLRLEAFHRRKDGTAFPVDVSTCLIALGGRDVVLGIDRDITARKRAEALQNAVYHIAQASELVESLSALLPQIQRIISEVMPAENFYFALYDQARNRLSFPYSIDEVDETYSGEEIEAGRGLTAYVLRTGKSLLCTEAIHEKLAQQGEIELIGIPSRIWLGVPLIVHAKVIGVMVVQHYSNPHAYGEREQRVLEFVSSQVAMAIDRKQAEEALRESEERYQLANRATFNAIWDWNLQTNALWWNENFQTLFGYCAEEIEPGIESWTNRIHPEDLERVEAGIHAAIDSGRQSWSDHYRFRRKDGTYAEIDDRGYISREVSGKPVRMIGAMQDVTERKQAEQRVFELALERERMALLTKFILDVSHEFRTPLTIMQTNVYLLGRLEDPAKRQRRLAQIGDQVTGITRLVELLVEMARLDSGVPFTLQPTDLNGLIGAVAGKLDGAVAAKCLTLHLALAPDLPSIPADGNRLGRALHELLDNAVRYTPAGGSVTVHTGLQIADGGLRIDDVEGTGKSLQSASGNSQWVTVAVQDSGPGIPPEALPRIFERFYRQDVAHTTPGFGLGLPIARAIVERHGGRLEVESQPGAGSAFWIRLPLAAGA